MFSLQKQKIEITNVNGRHEKHGDENVLAADVECIGDFSNDILAEFHPALRSCLYEKATNGDLADQGDDRPTAFRFNQLVQPFKWDVEIVGAKIAIAWGLTNIYFDLSDINKFRIECHDGGTVTVQFRIQVHPSEEELAKLFMMMDTNVDMTIEPPEERVDLGGEAA